MSGQVFLVGAGPGDPELITVRGLRLLQRAEVVVYDRLANPALLAEAPAPAERIYVGKRPGQHAMAQEAINRLLVARAQVGRQVVRLKGGDPFVFGRGGEEAAACAAAGVAWEVVPGVTSAIGVPARAGIPVTHRSVAAAFAVVTARRAAGEPEPDWAALARIDTLVILMGVGRLPEITRLLVAHGRTPSCPAALIEQGTLEGERLLRAPLADLAAAAVRAGVRPPATIVVGEVARDPDRLRRPSGYAPWSTWAVLPPEPLTAAPVLRTVGP